MEKKATSRFTGRVENYIRYRPSYPTEAYDFLLQEKIISPASIVADIGSGTGISAEPLLKKGMHVVGVEPNDEMRAAAEKLLASFTTFNSVSGTAEQTTLAESSVDAILAGQAFHWFNRDATLAEFKRILKPGGHVILMWNDRRTDTTDFLKLYEEFLQMFATDYKLVNHKNIQDKRIFDSFFGRGNYREKWFYNYQDVDLDGLKGRVLSSSYMPDATHEDYDHMMYCLKKIYKRYEENNCVRLEYDTKIYYGKLEG